MSIGRDKLEEIARRAEASVRGAGGVGGAPVIPPAFGAGRLSQFGTGAREFQAGGGALDQAGRMINLAEEHNRFLVLL